MAARAASALIFVLDAWPCARQGGHGDHQTVDTHPRRELACMCNTGLDLYAVYAYSALPACRVSYLNRSEVPYTVRSISLAFPAAKSPARLWLRRIAQ